jgi:hypothetical protein
MRLAVTGMKRMKNVDKILVENSETTLETQSIDRARILKSVLKAVRYMNVDWICLI